MTNNFISKLLRAFGSKPKTDTDKAQTQLPKLENYDLSKTKGGKSELRSGGGWDLN